MCDDGRVQELPLTGRTVAVTAERKAEEIAAAFARRGARVLRAPAIRTVPLESDGELAEATQRVLSAPVDHLVVMTGVGFRGWLEAARANGQHERLLEHLGAAEILARGAKARGAVRGAGLTEQWTSPAEESAEVLDFLLDRGVAGRRVVVQVHGEPMLEFRQRLTEAGAEVVPVTVYRWTDPADLTALDGLIDSLIAGEVDALPLTSAPAAKNLLGRADRTGRGEQLREALQQVLIACVGPVTAAPVVAAGLSCVQPERARTGALVRLVTERLAGSGSAQAPQR